jgi:hypothetical protein
VKGKFDAIKFTRSMEKQLSVDPRRKKYQDALAGLQKRLAEREKAGADVSRLSGLLADAGKAVERSDFKGADELRSRIEDGLKGLGTPEEDDEVAQTRALMNEVELAGVENARALELIAQAEAAQKARDTKAARKLAQSARKETDKVLEGTASDAVAYAESLVAECDRVGMDVAAFKEKLGKVKEMMKNREFTSALQPATSLIDEIEPRRRAHFRDRLSTFAATIEKARGAGQDVTRMEDLLGRARQLVDGRDYEGAVEVLRGMEPGKPAAMEALSGGEDAAALEALVAGLEKAGQDVEALRVELERILGLRATDDASAASAAAEFRKTAGERLKSASECAGLLEQVRAAITGGAKMGIMVKTFSDRAAELDGL